MNTIPFRIYGLDHVQLAMPAGQEDVARDFYLGLLQLSEIPKPANLARRGGVWFAGGALRLHLGIEADFHPARKAHPAFLVQNLDAIIRHLQQAGVIVVSDEPLESYNRIYISDPFGNRIELLEPVGSSGISKEVPSICQS
jgi:catechol 2,3-dioxygenase-like lactoylglutathione lyase family enzyme